MHQCNKACRMDLIKTLKGLRHLLGWQSHLVEYAIWRLRGTAGDNARAAAGMVNPPEARSAPPLGGRGTASRGRRNSRSGGRRR